MDKTPKDQLRADAIQLLAQGNSKQAVYEQLVQKYGFAKLVAEELKELPSKKALERYGKWNHALFAFIVLVVAVLFAGTGKIMTLFWFILILWVVAKRMLKYYIFITAIGAVSLISLVVLYLTDNEAGMSLINVVVWCLPALILVFFPLWLTKKLSPSPIEQKETYTDQAGVSRVKLRYVFPNEGD